VIDLEDADAVDTANAATDEQEEDSATEEVEDAEQRATIADHGDALWTLTKEFLTTWASASEEHRSTDPSLILIGAFAAIALVRKIFIEKPRAVAIFGPKLSFGGNNLSLMDIIAVSRRLSAIELSVNGGSSRRVSESIAMTVADFYDEAVATITPTTIGVFTALGLNANDIRQPGTPSALILFGFDNPIFWNQLEAQRRDGRVVFLVATLAGKLVLFATSGSLLYLISHPKILDDATADENKELMLRINQSAQSAPVTYIPIGATMGVGNPQAEDLDGMYILLLIARLKSQRTTQGQSMQATLFRDDATKTRADLAVQVGNFMSVLERIMAGYMTTPMFDDTTIRAYTRLSDSVFIGGQRHRPSQSVPLRLTQGLQQRLQPISTIPSGARALTLVLCVARGSSGSQGGIDARRSRNNVRLAYMIQQHFFNGDCRTPPVELFFNDHEPDVANIPYRRDRERIGIDWKDQAGIIARFKDMEEKPEQDRQMLFIDLVDVYQTRNVPNIMKPINKLNPAAGLQGTPRQKAARVTQLLQALEKGVTSGQLTTRPYVVIAGIGTDVLNTDPCWFTRLATLSSITGELCFVNLDRMLSLNIPHVPWLCTNWARFRLDTIMFLATELENQRDTTREEEEWYDQFPVDWFENLQETTMEAFCGNSYIQLILTWALIQKHKDAIKKVSRAYANTLPGAELAGKGSRMPRGATMAFEAPLMIRICTDCSCDHSVNGPWRDHPLLRSLFLCHNCWVLYMRR